MRRIWLRMGPVDFQNVEQFLKLQLDFLKDDTFDLFSSEDALESFYGYDVFGETLLNQTWDESNQRISFWIETDDGKVHHLPQVHYDISNLDGEKICYVYAVQSNKDGEKIPRVEKLLRNLNSGIQNPNVYQGMVYTMELFLNLLKEKNISKIRVPVLQVLSYRYHELLSEYHRERFESLWGRSARCHDRDFINQIPEYMRVKYEETKENYDAFVDKQDIISKLKTENLIALFERMMIHVPELELLNDIDSHDGYLEFRIFSKKKNKIKRLEFNEK